MFYLTTKEQPNGERSYNKQALEALRVAEELDQWLEEHNDSGLMPVASVTIADGYMSIAIGDTTVWDTETRDGDEPLTKEVCLREYRSYLESLSTPFVNEAKSSTRKWQWIDDRFGPMGWFGDAYKARVENEFDGGHWRLIEAEEVERMARIIGQLAHEQS